MPVQTSFPGIYIQELPSSTHSITAAPTSVTVFVGYSHPFKTRPDAWNRPVRIFSFTDYETWFGGFFRSSVFDAEADDFGDLAQAVNQFFLNGGADAYVVGLQARPGGSAIAPATATVGPLVFSAREVVDADHELTVTVSNVGGPPGSFPAGSGSVPFSALIDETADVTLAFGPPATSPLSGQGGYVTETYRQVSLNPVLPNGRRNPNYVGTRIGPDADGKVVSSLATVRVSPSSAPFVAAGAVKFSPLLAAGSGSSIFGTLDFVNVFQADSPLDKVGPFNLLVIPGVTNTAVLGAATSFCEGKRAFLIIDPPPTASADGTDPAGSETIQDAFESGAIPRSQNSAVYFPYLAVADPLTGQPTNPVTNRPYEVPPSGTVAGIYSRVDFNRGVWKAPAGLETTLANVTDVAERGRMTDQRQGTLNTIGVNCVRSFPGVGPVVWGARTSISENVAFQQWKYVPVRRMALFLEQSLYAALGWVVFEPNDDPLWSSIRASVEAFMLGLFRQGAFAGKTPNEAFQVKCDRQTTTPQDVDNGIVNVVVAFAPLKPAEFVVIQISQLAAQAQTP